MVSKLRYCRIELIFKSCSFTSAFFYSKENKGNCKCDVTKKQEGTYGLIYNCCHDVTKNAKLEEVAQLYARVTRQQHRLLVKIKYESKALERVSHKLRQIIIEVLIDELYVSRQVSRELLQVIEYLPEILLDKCE